MKLLCKLTVLCFILTASIAHAYSVLVISDIDDTLKDSRVRNRVQSVVQAFKRNAFSGMSELYGRLMASQNVTFNYVSTGPREIMGAAHRDFLKQNAFPVGGLYMPRWRERKNFKWRTISRLVAASQADLIILIGDNGEMDPEVYDRILTEYGNSTSGRKIVAFIRQTYSDGAVLSFRERAFSSAEEIEAELHSLGLFKGLLECRDFFL